MLHKQMIPGEQYWAKNNNILLKPTRAQSHKLPQLSDKYGGVMSHCWNGSVMMPRSAKRGESTQICHLVNKSTKSYRSACTQRRWLNYWQWTAPRWMVGAASGTQKYFNEGWVDVWL